MPCKHRPRRDLLSKGKASVGKRDISTYNFLHRNDHILPYRLDRPRKPSAYDRLLPCGGRLLADKPLKASPL